MSTNEELQNQDNRNERGAACYNDPLTGNNTCKNNLTEAEAQQFAQMHNLILVAWNAGKTCGEVDC